MRCVIRLHMFFKQHFPAASAVSHACRSQTMGTGHTGIPPWGHELWCVVSSSQIKMDVLSHVFLSPQGVKGRGGITDFLSFHDGEEPVLGGTVQSGGSWPQTSSLMTFLYR